MKEIVINRQNEGTKLLRMLAKLLPGAQMNFLYKMLRKKNITLNEKKASGNELLNDGDIIKVYFSDETYAKFSGNGQTENRPHKTGEFLLSPIFEDADIILCNKPAGVLSQRADKDDISMVEMISSYLEGKGEYDPGDVTGFKPAVCNRLDRNTSGIIAAGKSVSGLKYLSEGFKKREFEKFYLCVVKGVLKERVLLNGLWSKDSHGNKVSIRNIEIRVFTDGSGRPTAGSGTPGDDFGFPGEFFVKGNVPVQTYAEPIVSNGKATLCLVRLMTGKTHQIRAQLSVAGYPLLGDHKYGDKKFNSYYTDIYGIEFQLLHAYFLGMPDRGMFFADIPDHYERVLKGEGLWTEDIQDKVVSVYERFPGSTA